MGVIATLVSLVKCSLQILHRQRTIKDALRFMDGTQCSGENMSRNWRGSGPFLNVDVVMALSSRKRINGSGTHWRRQSDDARGNE